MSEMVARVAMAFRKSLGVSWPYTGHKELMDEARAALGEVREVIAARKAILVAELAGHEDDRDYCCYKFAIEELTDLEALL